MNAPIFELAAASEPVTDLLGKTPVRFFLFGEAEEKTPRPYACWQTTGGSPGNYLSGNPDTDAWVVQVDVYGLTAESARAVARALRNALEPRAYVVSWNGDFREPETRLYRYSFTVEFLTPRQ